jgi:hypothetical protein
MASGTTITIPSGCYFIKFALPGTYGATYKNDVSWNYPSTVTTYQPYSNICPISGHTSATMTRTGKNLIDDNSETAITFTLPQGTYYAKRFPITTDKQINSKFEALIGNTWTTINSGTYDNGQFVATGGLGWGESPEQTIVLSKSYEFRMSIYTLGSFRGKAHVMLTTGAMPSVYEPYQGTSVTIDLDGTRYGGVIDVLTGELTVTKYGFDATSDLTYGTSSQGTNCNVFSMALSSNNLPSSVAYTAISNRFSKNIPSDTPGRMVHSGNTIYFAISKSEVEYTIASLKTWLDNHPTQFVYKLATPITVQLTPSQMSTLLGENHIWADTGDVEVTYRADTKLFIQEQIAEAEKTTRKMIADSATADGKAPKSLATGDLIIVGDELRKTTAAIGNGSAITASNSTTATLADVIKALQ